MVALHNIEKTYLSVGQQVDMLRCIALDIVTGEFVTFIGPSGAVQSQPNGRPAQRTGTAQALDVQYARTHLHHHKRSHRRTR